jgi:hypothetical protein
MPYNVLYSTCVPMNTAQLPEEKFNVNIYQKDIYQSEKTLSCSRCEDKSF